MLFLSGFFIICTFLILSFSSLYHIIFIIIINNSLSFTTETINLQISLITYYYYGLLPKIYNSLKLHTTLHYSIFRCPPLPLFFFTRRDISLINPSSIKDECRQFTCECPPISQQFCSAINALRDRPVLFRLELQVVNLRHW